MGAGRDVVLAGVYRLQVEMVLLVGVGVGVVVLRVAVVVRNGISRDRRGAAAAAARGGSRLWATVGRV